MLNCYSVCSKSSKVINKNILEVSNKVLDYSSTDLVALEYY
ncbi:hypothetical protein LEP1GSC059_1898 [Leptospira noguchii serovar Panama str. CZ214]|uniref:Uncharacterized protein n=1 Tax=Leptospira noguchii serovar Panama str. CZ214 TaxID=1001595 RepID=T0FJK0_9LEPT|nr:hypothetical protein LEP1GSC059_1898 [Leptospira noguchii serovar Panama str. CZ214]